MKILTVCGMGSGSSLILKMNVDSILSKLGIDAEVSACDLGSVGGQSVDLIISTKELQRQLDHYPTEKIFVTNIVNKSDLQKQLEEVLGKA